MPTDRTPRTAREFVANVTAWTLYEAVDEALLWLERDNREEAMRLLTTAKTMGEIGVDKASEK